ncbi:histidine phosphatase family protein [Alteromonas sp. ASW11-19]|uniref:Histidine phosphatase family protein n=1 Tax=Alteromonas salexigens TaxID=2982530 RepID=A0ABT2VPT7_9ALTE|nr:histidine phosphatase family protein [Alteromonas salexigens]MCU7555333.1 histidine phosphatase family protein [Alteromonas salexigens]
MKAVLFLCCYLMLGSAHAAAVYLTRHYEKNTGPDPTLTAEGVARAQQLAARLGDIPVTAIYTTPYQRTTETVTPLAEDKGLKLRHYAPDDLNAFADMLKSLPGNVVVAGHSNTTPQLVRLLGGPEFSLAESDFGKLFILTPGQPYVPVTVEMIPKTPPATP